MEIERTFLKDSKRILLVGHEMTYTGAPQSLWQMAKALQELGYDISVWTLMDGAFIQEFQKLGIQVECLNFPNDATESLQRKLEEFDVVIANTIFCASFARYAQRFVMTVLYVREAQNTLQLIQDCHLNEEDIRQIFNIVCVSEYAKEFLCERYSLNNVFVIHNFVEDCYSKIKNNRISWENQEEVHFLVSGTLEPRKGQDVAIKAFLEMPEEVQEKAHLHMVGQMPQWAKEYQKKLNLGYHERISYHGEIRDRSELLKLYASMDVILVPSYDESCSLVALEAAMLQKAILLTENVGAKYLIDHNCVFETGNSSDLSIKMQECIKNVDLQRLGMANRQSYLKCGTKEKYQEAISRYLNFLYNSEKKIEEDRKVKVSVIIPVYNVEIYLKQCMESVLNQTLKDIEVICVNDGSTDRSFEILQRYQSMDSRIKVINTDNYGYGHAMNIGMAEAIGEYIGIVEPDDYVDTKMYEVLYHRAVAVGADIVKADFYRFYGEDEKECTIYQMTAREIENYNRIICPREEKSCFRYMMNTWSGIYRRTFLEENEIRHNETPGASYQDNGFWFKGFCYAKRIYFVNAALYHNRRDNPASSVNDCEKVYCANEEYEYIRNFLLDNPDMEKEFLYQYSMKKYHTYLFTLERVAWEYKKGYLKRFSEEFCSAKKNGELKQAVFTPQEWSNLHWIMRDYEEYYEKVVKAQIQISVIVPVYQAGNSLKQCLESLKQQSFTKFEVICVNGGSSDDSERIMEEFARRDKRFRIVRQNHAGAGVARNRGLDEARGEYVIFLDSDDYFAPEMLLHAWQKIRETDSDICVMGSWQYDEQTEECCSCTYSLPIEKYPVHRPFCVEEMQKNPFRSFMGWACDKIYRKSFLLNNHLKFQELCTSNDMYFVYMSLFKADKITILDEKVLYKRRNIPESLSMTRNWSWKCFYHALIAMKQELQNMGLDKKYRVYFTNYALHSCLWNLMTLHEEVACKLLEQLENGGFQELGVEELEATEFEYEQEYKNYMMLQNEKKVGLLKCRKIYELQKQKKITNSNINNGGVQSVKKRFSSDAEYYQYCLNETWNSKSYKIGRMITWLPRKLREKLGE